ncbi:MFS transporter [Candidatus Woesearchaeota archaeon]|nr:MFS transporter [Candidatus Woesearchaeota archaeon]
MPIDFINRHKINKIAFRLPNVAFFLSLAYAARDSIWSIYLDTFMNNEVYVGLFTGILTLISVVLFFFLTPIIERYREKNTYLWGAIGLLIGYFIFYIAGSMKVVIFASLIYIVGRVFHTVSQGILISDSCAKKDLGKTEGYVYAIRNIGYMIGPLLGGFIAGKLGIHYVFIFSAVFVLFGMTLFRLAKIKEINHHTKDDATIKGSIMNMKNFFSKKRFTLLYAVSGGISLYWGMIFIYVPLYILKSGYGEHIAGIVLFAVSAPLVIFEYKVGKVADIYGYKRFFIYGYLLLALFSLFSYFSGNIIILIVCLTVGSIGASFLEGTRESFFFLNVTKSEEEKYYGPFITHTDSFSTIGKFAGAVFLIFFPLKAIFLLTSALMLIFTVLSFFVRQKKENSHKLHSNP